MLGCEILNDNDTALYCYLLIYHMVKPAACTHKAEGEERPERLLPAKEGETQVRHLVVSVHNASSIDLALV